MQPVLNLHTWVSLPTDVRHKIRATFKIPRSSNVFVNDGKIETDGTTHEDMKTLTVEKMQRYIPSEETDFNKLFDLVVAKIVEEIQKPKLVTIPEQSLPLKEPIIPGETLVVSPTEKKNAKKKKSI